MPVAFGYVSVPAHPDPAHPDPGHAQETLRTTTQQLAGFSAREGYTLAAVFVDARGATETGLYRMLEALRHGDAVAVVVPDLGHLRHVGCLVGADLATAARYLRARLLTLAPEGEQTR